MAAKRSAPPLQVNRTAARETDADVAGYSRSAYLSYAMSVALGRAIPASEDGLKPVQRRILFAMHQLRLAAPAKPQKCARVVGTVLGKFHPHGDSSVYESMVLMSQPFKMRYPLVHGEGNFGDVVDPRSYAAMRYTEARLTPLAQALLSELGRPDATLDAETCSVPVVQNYDGTTTEPALLPARLPFLLLNATPGVAVGMASTFLPHNLTELAAAVQLLLVKPNTSLDKLLEIMPGPDFPTGGRLISSPEDIRKVYETGRGTLRVRSCWRIERLPRNRWIMHIEELPPDVSPAKVFERLGELLNPAPRAARGGKAAIARLSPEQLRLKKLFGDILAGFKDLSSDGALDLAITPRDHTMDPDALAAVLCAHTDLETTVSPNLVAVVPPDVNFPGALPRSGGLLEWLLVWCGFRLRTVTARTRNSLEMARRRLHLLDGRLLILGDLDRAIAIIRQSASPRDDLMEHFGLSQAQAEDVLEIRLRALGRIEYATLASERTALLMEATRLEKLLANEPALRREIVKEIAADAKAFGDARRTKIDPDQASQVRRIARTETIAARLAPEPIAVALTERGWIAWRPARALEDAMAPGFFKTRTGDTVRRVFFGDRNNHLLLMDAQGRGYSIHLADLPTRDGDAPLTQWLDPRGSAMLEGAIAAPATRLLLVSSTGFGFILTASSWIGRARAGKELLVLLPGSLPLPPQPLTDLPPDAAVVVLASSGRAVSFALADVKVLPRGKGVGLIGLRPGESVNDFIALPRDCAVTLVVPSGATHVVKPQIWLDHWGPRASGRKGKNLHKSAPSAVFARLGRQAPAA